MQPPLHLSSFGSRDCERPPYSMLHTIIRKLLNMRSSWQSQRTLQTWTRSRHRRLWQGKIENHTFQQPTFVINDETNVLHRSMLQDIEAAPLTWNTRCGWKFGTTTRSTLFEMPATHPWKKVCKKCLRKERAALQEEQKASESLSSASSSSSSSSDD